MKKELVIRFYYACILVLFMGLIFSCSKEMIDQEEKKIYSQDKTADPDLIEGHYIVVVSNKPAGKDSKAASALEELTVEMNKKPGARVNRTYKNALTGFAAELTDKQVQELKKDPRVKYIEQDRYIYSTGDITVQNDAFWGLDRIDQRENLLDRAYAYTNSGTGVTVYIVDSGIRYLHNEFGGRASLGYDFVLEDEPENTDPSQVPGEDCLGHGTHVAGIVGGNKYGVAKGVKLKSVRVLTCDGKSPSSRVIAAIEWITQNAIKPAVVNISLGFGIDSALVFAVENSVEAGIQYAISAGNQNGDACNQSPAAAAGVLTVGASDFENKKASFSNFGGCVDIYAPGVSIKSASYLDNESIVYMSGTSMSAPHVAGVAALYLEVNPNATPAEIKEAIVGNSTANIVSNVPSGTNNLLYSLWESVDFIPPPLPDLMLRATGEKLRSKYVANLTWNSTEVNHIIVFEDGVAHFTEHFNDGEQQIRLRDKGRDATYTLKICEVGYDNCSEEVILIFGNGSGEPVNASPSAGFYYSANLLNVQFTDISSDSDGSITTWNWDFGDGNSSTVQNPQHVYATSGTYSVSLTVTDDAGATGSTSQNVTVNAEELEPGENVLNANGYKVKGAWNADLTWTSSGTSEMTDIYRNGIKVATVSNSGSYTDATSFKGGGSLNYKICEAGTTNCSNEVTVQF